MKKFIYFLTIIITSFGITSCSEVNDDPDDGPEDGMIWDIMPIAVKIVLMDEEGNNMLDPAVEGNWVGEEMLLICNDKAYDIDWDYNGNNSESRAIMEYFYGFIWTGGIPWVDTKNSCLSFGEFNGGSNRDLSLTFAITAMNCVFDFKFSHRCFWKDHEPHFDDHIIYAEKDIEGNVLELIVPHNPNYKQSAN